MIDKYLNAAHKHNFVISKCYIDNTSQVIHELLVFTLQEDVTNEVI